LAFLDPPWPPGEQCGGADTVALGLQHGAAGELHLLQLVEITELAVDKRRIGERPEMFARLQLRRVGGQEQQVDMLGYLHVVARMPPRPIEHQHDLLGRSRSHRLGEGG
jgi:hypothetical protein